MSFSHVQIKTAQLLASGLTQEETAKRVGISCRTVSRWLCNEEFKNLSFGLVNSSSPAKNEAKIQSTSRTDNESSYELGDLIPLAIRTVVNILTDPDARKADQLKAVSLVGEWAGLTSDFNIAVSTLRRYNLVVYESDEGRWAIHDQREKQTFDE